MAAPDREIFEIVLGAIMTQSAVLEFLVKQGIIERDALIQHLAARRVSWEKTAPPNALFAVDTLPSILAGRQAPAPPVTLN